MPPRASSSSCRCRAVRLRSSIRAASLTSTVLVVVAARSRLHLDFVYWPSNFLEVLQCFDRVSLIDLRMLSRADGIAGTSLAFRFDFRSSVLLIPMLLAYTLALAPLVALSTGRALAWRRVHTPRAWGVLQWAMLVVYPLVSLKAFQVHDCIPYDDGGSMVLRAEPTMACYEGEHATIAVVSVVVHVLFGVAQPVGFLLATLADPSRRADPASRPGAG